MWLGKLTYGLYVYHILGVQFGGLFCSLLQAHHWITARAVPVWHTVILFTLTVTVAAISYRFFESFFLRLKEKFSPVKSRPLGKALAQIPP